ncbi:hypothetical protein PCANC_02959 [Puccinia coronata f. sp. avenae]|uniref:glucan 1,3-beta-glucosidase n=1 Tax=Puccinia coronata f. sp. avenae TaxID=200324 RepID=A0A2N5T8E0_9BASI|nr:hypothetical protein PCANC_02959 [Puccinia coronata f. sp. avenae]PLW23932.1 hypothetical protein PCASD_14176 [Puccinia coronata f. sp. avenae]
MTTPAGSRLPTPPRLMIPSESEPVDHMSVHDSYPPRARSPSSEPPEFFNHHPHRDPFAHEPSSPLNFPRRPSYLRNSAATCDSELTRIGSESWLHASGSVIALDKLEETEIEGVGLVHPSTSKPSGLKSFYNKSAPPLKKNRQHKVCLSLAGLALVVLAITIGTVVSMRKSRLADLGNVNPADGTLVTASGEVVKLWGKDGDKIKTDNGTTFEYKNPLGGTWVSIPFNDTAKPQGDSPPLNQPWDYSKRRILGVNLGGWLVLEPFITPYMFEPFSSHDANGETPTVVDEWTLSVALGDKLASTMEEHYRTFITEEDFMQIAAAGLNWVRLPVGWWMIETWAGEPFLEGVSFKYFLKALQWARKYGLRVNLDLHAVPGSQNGFNHSGKLGSINFLVGLMGVTNAQRTLNYIRTLTQFISQPQYVNVVPMFSVLNEALVQKIGVTQMRSFYLQVYQMIRGITGYGAGKGPMMIIHDGFQGAGAGHTGWGGFLAGADRIGLDTHTYFAFDKQSNDSLGYNSYKPCTYWAKGFNQTNADFGFNFAGEYSLAVNDCGLWLNNVGIGSRYDGTYPTAKAPDSAFPMVGSCDLWKDYRTWTSEMKKSIADLAATSQDAMQNSFFWTWKISRSIRTPDMKPNPMWDYQLGLQQGWIRADARGSVGACGVVAGQQGATIPQQPWAGQYSDWQTGGGSDAPRTIDPAQLAQYGQWPPNQIIAQPGQNLVYPDVNNLPQYVPTGTPVTLKPESPNPRDVPVSGSLDPGSGWANPADRAGWYVPVKGCQYPDPWAGGGLPAPSSPFCAGSAIQPAKTSAPSLRRRYNKN